MHFKEKLEEYSIKRDLQKLNIMDIIYCVCDDEEDDFYDHIDRVAMLIDDSDIDFRKLIYDHLYFETITSWLHIREGQKYISFDDAYKRYRDLCRSMNKQAKKSEFGRLYNDFKSIVVPLNYELMDNTSAYDRFNLIPFLYKNMKCEDSEINGKIVSFQADYQILLSLMWNKDLIKFLRGFIKGSPINDYSFYAFKEDILHMLTALNNCSEEHKFISYYYLERHFSFSLIEYVLYALVYNHDPRSPTDNHSRRIPFDRYFDCENSIDTERFSDYLAILFDVPYIPIRHALIDYYFYKMTNFDECKFENTIKNISNLWIGIIPEKLNIINEAIKEYYENTEEIYQAIELEIQKTPSKIKSEIKRKTVSMTDYKVHSEVDYSIISRTKSDLLSKTDNVIISKNDYYMQSKHIYGVENPRFNELDFLYSTFIYFPKYFMKMEGVDKDTNDSIHRIFSLFLCTAPFNSYTNVGTSNRLSWNDEGIAKANIYFKKYILPSMEKFIKKYTTIPDVTIHDEGNYLFDEWIIKIDSKILDIIHRIEYFEFLQINKNTFADFIMDEKQKKQAELDNKKDWKKYALSNKSSLIRKLDELKKMIKLSEV